MTSLTNHISRNILSLFLSVLFYFGYPNYLFAAEKLDTTPFSTVKQALDFLTKHKKQTTSLYWPEINAVRYYANLRKNIENPLGIYEGSSTNFCSYAAYSFLPLHFDPLNYVRFMVDIFEKGKAIYGKEYFEPSLEIRRAAGTLNFKGELDIRDADQVWFLTLADHFKGYVNMLDRQYHTGDENKLWASVNYAKFNRMIRRLFNYETEAVGSDLFRPGIRDIYTYLSERLETGTVALYLNNPRLYKKNHAQVRLSVPTHFIILLQIEEVGDKIAITYWDYGFKSRQEFTEKYLKKLIFGVTHITPKSRNAN